MLTMLHSVTFCQLLPASFVNWMFPSSVPTQMTPSFTSEGAIVRIVPRACFESFSSGRTRVKYPALAPLFSTIAPRSRPAPRCKPRLRPADRESCIRSLLVHRKPVPLCDLSIVSSAHDSRRAAVLLRAVHPVRKPVIRCDPVEFSRRLVVPRRPGFPSVQADRCALVDSQHDSLRICGINPDRVVIVSSGRALDRSERMSAVIRTVQILRRHINNVRVLRVHVNLAKVPRPFDPLVLRRLFPRRSCIVRPVQSALLAFRLHDDVHSLSVISRRNRNSFSPPIPFGQSVPRDLRPGDAFIQRLVEPAAGPVRCSFLSRLSNAVPQGRVNHVRISRLKTEIHRRCHIVFVQNFLPTPPAICRAENSSLFVRP